MPGVCGVSLITQWGLASLLGCALELLSWRELVTMGWPVTLDSPSPPKGTVWVR